MLAEVANLDFAGALTQRENRELSIKKFYDGESRKGQGAKRLIEPSPRLLPTPAELAGKGARLLES